MVCYDYLYNYFIKNVYHNSKILQKERTTYFSQERVLYSAILITLGCVQFFKLDSCLFVSQDVFLSRILTSLKIEFQI